MTDTLIKPRPRLYKGLSIFAAVLAGLAVMWIAYILLAVVWMGPENHPLLMLLIFPAAMLFAAAKIWLFTRTIRITDQTRAAELRQGKRVTAIDMALFGLAALWAFMQIRSETPFGGHVGFDLGGLVYALPFLVLPAGMGLIIYNRSRKTPLMSENMTGMLIVGAGLVAMAGVYLYMLLWPSMQSLPGY